MFKESESEKTEWITINGKKVELKPGEEAEDSIRESLPTAKGEKEKATKEALSKSYFKRHGLLKSIFAPRDEVVFDEYRKSGLIASVDGNHLRILSDNRMHIVSKDSTFKKSELIGNIHWDTLTKVDRIELLSKSNIDKSFSDRNWMNLPTELRTVIQKINSPAGYDTSSGGTNNPIYNPIKDDKTVSQSIKEEIESQHKDSDGDTDEKKSTD